MCERVCERECERACERACERVCERERDMEGKQHRRSKHVNLRERVYGYAVCMYVLIEYVMVILY